MAEKKEILTTMLNSVPDTFDKSDGSFIFNSLAPVAEQLAKVDDSTQVAIDKMNISNLIGDELARRVRERTGIVRKEATYAKGEVTLTGSGMIHVGDLFETRDGVQFEAIESKSISNVGSVSIRALKSGEVGNVPAETIILFPITLAGFTSVINEAPTHNGFEAESDSDLLARYYDRIQTPSTSGNKNQFRNWAKEVAGVGDARVIPLWNGDNTLKIVIINSARQPSNTELVEMVQEYIDPNGSGTGDGVAPIGAYVTVESAAGVDVDVEVGVTLSSGYTLQQAVDNFTDDLIKYLAEIAFVENIVSYAKIGSVLLSATGIEDYVDLIVNGGSNNIVIQPNEVAIVGSVNFNV